MDMLLQAEHQFAQGDTIAAIEDFKKVLEIYPQSYTASLRLSEIYYDLNDPFFAVQYANIAINVVDDYIERQFSILTDLQAPLATEDRKKHEQLLHHYQVDKGRIHYRKGLIRLKQNRYPDAERAFRIALKQDPENADIMTDLAILLTQSGRIEEGLALMRSAYQADTTHTMITFNLANLFYKLDKKDSALYYYTKVSQNNPALKLPYLYSGIIYAENRESKLAIEKLTHYIAMDTTSEEAYFRRALLYIDEGLWNEALSDWENVLRITPQHVDALRNRGLTYFQLQEYAMAIADFSGALELEPTQAYTRINRGYALLLAGEAKAALQDLSQGIEQMPNYYMGYYFRALTYWKLKKKKRACTDVNEAIRLGMKETDIDSRLLKKCL